MSRTKSVFLLGIPEGKKLSVLGRVIDLEDGRYVFFNSLPEDLRLQYATWPNVSWVSGTKYDDSMIAVIADLRASFNEDASQKLRLEWYEMTPEEVARITDDNIHVLGYDEAHDAIVDGSVSSAGVGDEGTFSYYTVSGRTVCWQETGDDPHMSELFPDCFGKKGTLSIDFGEDGSHELLFTIMSMVGLPQELVEDE